MGYPIDINSRLSFHTTFDIGQNGGESDGIGKTGGVGCLSEKDEFASVWGFHGWAPGFGQFGWCVPVIFPATEGFPEAALLLENVLPEDQPPDSVRYRPDNPRGTDGLPALLAVSPKNDRAGRYFPCAVCS